MKRGMWLIVILLLLVDLAGHGYLGSVKVEPPQTAVGTSCSIFHHFHSKKVDSCLSLPSQDWQDMFSPSQSKSLLSLGHLTLKIITSCNIGGSGGIPL